MKRQVQAIRERAESKTTWVDILKEQGKENFTKAVLAMAADEAEADRSALLEDRDELVRERDQADRAAKGWMETARLADENAVHHRAERDKAEQLAKDRAHANMDIHTRLMARVREAEADAAALRADVERWKFDADTTRQAHVCTHARVSELTAALRGLVDSVTEYRRYREFGFAPPRTGHPWTVLCRVEKSSRAALAGAPRELGASRPPPGTPVQMVEGQAIQTWATSGTEPQPYRDDDVDREIAWKRDDELFDGPMLPRHPTNEPAVENRCEWREGSDGEWDTACGGSWVFPEGGPVENEAKYCAKCGRLIKVSPYKELEDDGGHPGRAGWACRVATDRCRRAYRHAQGGVGRHDVTDAGGATSLSTAGRCAMPEHWWWRCIGHDLWLWWHFTKRRWRCCPRCDGWGGMPIEPMPGHERICPRCFGTGRRWRRRRA